MNNVIIKENIVENMIYEVRGVQVMLDSDLAKLYECKNGTKEINQAVKNNPDKFPDRFTFRISENEYNILKSNFLTSKGGSRKGHTVFTEEGVAMLATILHTPVATQVSINIMDAFVRMRKYIGNNLLVQNNITNMVIKHDNDIKEIQKVLNQFEEKKKVNEIYFNGQIFDAYYKIKSIFKEANNKLIIIDAYADIEILEMIKELNIEVMIITKNNNTLTKQDIEKYNKEYSNLKVYYSNDFHDRYFILDNNIIYHSGTSINYAGSKTFSINILEDEIVKTSLLNKVSKLIK